MEFNPAPDAVMKDSDQLVVLGRPASLRELETAAGQATGAVSARVLDGVAVAAAIREELKPGVEAFTARAGRPPGLGIVLVGSHAPSEIYVRNKLKAASRHRLSGGSRPAAGDRDAGRGVEGRRRSQCQPRPRRDPRPGSRCRRRWERVRRRRSSTRSTRPRTSTGSRPSTSAGSYRTARRWRRARRRASSSCSKRSGIPMAGAHAVVIGRSDIVGKPMAMLLLHRSATVTICHSRTRDLPAVCREADILVAAVGRAAFVQPQMGQAGRDGHRRRHQPRHRPSDGRVALRRRLEAARRVREERRAASSATCIPRSSRWPAP